MHDATIARSELIVGGQKSGKSVRAETLAHHWLAANEKHRAKLIATGTAWDDEMQARIARHQRARAVRVPGLETVEEPRQLSAVLTQHSHAHTLLVVDCLTLWLTHWRMPLQGPAQAAPIQALCDTLAQLPGPVVLVSNEIGLGVIPMGREVRAFVDELGALNQRVAAVCERVTLMAAGLPLTLKERP